MKWQRFDLHHHTNEDYARGKNSFNYEKILKKYDEEGITLISITNHNTISKKSYDEYKEIIDNNGYEINLLPGIEVEFKMPEDGKGHMLIIFNDKYSLDKLEEFFSDVKKYDQNSDIYFKEYFPKLVNNLITNGFEEFITIPHFAKGANNIDYDTIAEDDLLPWLNSFDLLEGNVSNRNTQATIEKSIKMAKGTKDKPIIIGTDSGNTDETIKNINKLVYVLTEPSFKGLEKVINFPSTRLSKENTPPFLLENYIEKVKIDNEEIEFSPGLNTIIGRRGSGKSNLLNKIINAIYNGDNEIELTWSKGFPPNIDKITKYSQSELTDSLSDFMTEISKEDSIDFSLKLFGRESKVISEPVFDFVAAQKSIKNAAFDLLGIMYEFQMENFLKTTENFKKDLYNKTINELKNLSNRKNIDIIKNDIDKINGFIQTKDISAWFKNQLLNIEVNLKEFSQKAKPDNLESIENAINLLKEKNESIKLSSKDSVKTEKYENIINELEKDEIFEKAKSLCDFKNNVKDFVGDLYKNKEYVISDDIKTSQEQDESLTFDYAIKSFNGKIEEQEAIDKIVYFNCNINSGEITHKQKKIGKNYFNDLFETKYIPKVNGENIDADSLGQRHEKFINSKLKLSNVEIILLDQPDDDLDSKTVNESIIKRIEENYQSKQWIIITHDPKIVLNTDSRNIILANYNNNSFKDVNEKYKNITEEEVREFGFEILDARKEFPYRRGKEYIKGDKNDNNKK